MKPWTAAAMAARSTGASRCSTWPASWTRPGRRWSAAPPLRLRLTYIKDTRTGLWATREEVGYYPCQTRHGAKLLGCAIRAHWGIENRAHYVRGVTLGEDASRIRTKPGIMARIRPVALNVLRANGIQNISEALYANTVSFDQLLAIGTQ